jgi:RHS repeat-associated protein
MKTRMNLMIWLLTLLALFSAPPLASAYYDPGVQRWINRDPLGEAGFERLRIGASDVTGGGPHLYAFVRNSPTSSTDLFGLAIWKCSRQTGWNVPGLQHAYLWDDRSGTKGPRSCGREGAGWPGFGKARGVSSPLDKGPGADKCVAIPNSGGSEDAIMSYCRKPRYKPFPFSTCHDWVENSLKRNGFDDPYIYGNYYGPVDKFIEGWGGGSTL